MSAPKFFLFSLHLYATCAAQQDFLPVLLPPVPGNHLEGTCFSTQNLDQVKNDIGSSLDQTVVPGLDLRDSCPCGGAGPWRRIAYLNMSDVVLHQVRPVLQLSSHQMTNPTHVCVEE